MPIPLHPVPEAPQRRIAIETVDQVWADDLKQEKEAEDCRTPKT